MESSNDTIRMPLKMGQILGGSGSERGGDLMVASCGARSRPTTEMARFQRHAQRGMTLIEIMVVMAIIGLIGVVIAVNVTSSKKDAEVMATQTLITSTVAGAVDAYRATRSEFPESLDQLVEQKKLRKNQLVDAWNKPLTYEVNGDSYRLCSAGPDKIAGNADDICNNSDE